MMKADEQTNEARSRTLFVASVTGNKSRRGFEYSLAQSLKIESAVAGAEIKPNLTCMHEINILIEVAASARDASKIAGV
jgi:hypothetical protein